MPGGCVWLYTLSYAELYGVDYVLMHACLHTLCLAERKLGSLLGGYNKEYNHRQNLLANHEE